MTYEKYKTGTFRVCVFLTIFLEVFVYTIYKKTGSNEEILFVVAPVFLWSIYFFSLWIYKGFADKK
jgi:hypothetical protein